MDNRRIDVVSEGDDSLLLALRLIWPNAAGGKAKHFRVVSLTEKVAYYGEPTNRHHTELKQGDGGEDQDLLDTEVGVKWMPDHQDEEDGSHRPAGLYAWFTDYPEEGSIPLAAAPRPQSPMAEVNHE